MLTPTDTDDESAERRSAEQRTENFDPNPHFEQQPLLFDVDVARDDRTRHPIVDSNAVEEAPVEAPPGRNTYLGDIDSQLMP